MVMGILKCAVELPSASNREEDTVVNTFVIATQAGWDPTTDLLDVSGLIENFYNVAQVASNPIAGYLSDSISRNAGFCRMKFYDLEGHLDGSPVGPPVAEDSFTLASAGSSTQYPAEVAFVLTLRAQSWDDQAIEVGATRPRARYSGRLYLGPLNTLAGGSEVIGHVRPDANFRQVVRIAAKELQEALQAQGHSWVLWSRARSAVTVIQRVETDDAFDTQRRRGVVSTVRESLEIAP